MGSGVMRQNVYSSAVFIVELTSLQSNFTWTGLSPSAVLGTDSEDRIPLCSLVLTQYQSVMDRRTDRRICKAL